MTRLAASVLAGGLSAAACADLFGPDPIVTPQLQRLSIDDLATSLRHGGLMYVNARPADTSFRLQRGQRVPVEVAVSSGDAEQARLYRVTCPARDRGPGYFCFAFLVFMQEGVHAATLAPYVAAEGGRFHLISFSGRFAGVTLFDPEDLIARARRARSWPGVALTERSVSTCAPDVPNCFSLSDLTVPVPVDTGSAVVGDGIVQVRSGDTVFVRYRQPLGGTLQASQTVP